MLVSKKLRLFHEHLVEKNKNKNRKKDKKKDKKEKKRRSDV